MYIFRVQDDSGKGMYSAYSGFSEYLYRMAGDGEANHPGPYDDSKMAGPWGRMGHRQREGYLFGFASWEQLRAWIPNDKVMGKIGSLGLHILILEVPDEYCIVGYSQAVFLGGMGKEVKRYKLWRYAQAWAEKNCNGGE